VVARAAAARSYRKVAVLGTEWTMAGPVYPGALGRRGIGHAVPATEDRAEIHRVIMEELCLGEVLDSSRAAFAAIIERMAADGCDAVALVCTEIPILISGDLSPLPILDSTRLLAAAAVEAAVGAAPMPEWRGGPISDGR
jgi:aspartate racemase